MAQSLSQIYVHIIYHTKRLQIKRTNLDRLWAYIAGVARGMGSVVKIVGGEPDHVHVLCTLPRTVSTSDFIEGIKRESSKHVKSMSAEYANFSWQRGYAIYSVSESKLQTVMDYIQNQAEHHKTVSFQDEYKQWLMMYKVEYDERYLWTD